MDHWREGQTIFDRLDSLEKVSSHRFLSQSWYILPSNTQQGLKATQDDLKVAQEGLKDALALMDRIVNGEIMNAAFALFGHPSTSKQSKAEPHRKIIRQFPGVFAWARQTRPRPQRADLLSDVNADRSGARKPLDQGEKPDGAQDHH